MSDHLRITLPANRTAALAERLSEYYSRETGVPYPRQVVEKAISDWLEVRLRETIDDLADVLTTPSRDEAREFRRSLDRAMSAAGLTGWKRSERSQSPIFQGLQPFSAEKLGAMVDHFARRGSQIYKTKLNKLLFYADFTNYYLHGRSISGARYVHLPYGPVPDRYETLLHSLASSGTIDVIKGESFEMIKGGERPCETQLTHEEQQTLDWVLQQYGSLSSKAISELSHREKAYRFTKQGEEIAYEYAKFFINLPEKP
jgi:uncharacterized phage-associated protein